MSRVSFGNVLDLFNGHSKVNVTRQHQIFEGINYGFVVFNHSTVHTDTNMIFDDHDAVKIRDWLIFHYPL